MSFHNLLAPHILRSPEIFSHELLEFIHECEKQREDLPQKLSELKKELKLLIPTKCVGAPNATNIIRKRIEILDTCCVHLGIRLVDLTPASA